QVDRRLAAFRALGVDRRERLVDDRQRLQAQEVELHEADCLEIVLVELRRCALGLAVERPELGEGPGRAPDAARMRAGSAPEAFGRWRHVDQPAALLLAPVRGLQVFAFGARATGRHAGLERDQLRDPVDGAIRLAVPAADAADAGT